MPTDTIDIIKRRMIQNASKIWGYHDVQDINSFDPVLSLLIGALAEEVSKISEEINKSDARIVEKLLELLFNQNIFTHFPAHAIAYAKPVQSRVEINDYYQFYTKKSITGSIEKDGQVEKKDIYFTPTSNSALFNGEIKYLFAGKHFYEMDGQFKEILAEKSQNSSFNYSKFVLGLKLDPSIETLEGLSLFFSFKNLQTEERFYHLLHSANWKINGKEVDFEKGLQASNSNQENSLFEIIKKDNNLSYKSSSYINDFYSRKFMTLGKQDNHKNEFSHEKYEPQILEEFLQNEKLKISKEGIVWVEVKISEPITSEDVSDLFISMNCFPVVNRELIEKTNSINKGINIIPLLTDDLFFDVKEVSDSRNTKYIPKTSVSSLNNGDHTYILRQGGIARFDSRDARETVNNLIGLVRDEAAAFSAKGADLVSSELKQLDQILSRLQQRINNSNIANDLNTYLILDSKSNYDKVHVQFWSIIGDVANNLRPGTKLSVYRGIDLEDKNIALITQTIGGRQKLSKEDKLNTIRRSLLSKGRIVTVEDIKALSFELFGDELKTAEVKKGVSLDPSQGKGLSRTLDIHLSLKSNSKLTEEDVWHKTEGLKVRLKQDSINLLPYRVFVNK